jgi:hypothetical protein
MQGQGKETGMAAVAFDTLKYARRLMEAGVPEKQAETQAELMAEAFVYNIDALVTKDYLDARFAEQEARVDARFTAQDARLDQRFAAMTVQFVETRGQFKLIYWMLAVVIASTVIPQLNVLFAG